MKGLIKEVLILVGIVFILYFLLTKTPLKQYTNNLFSGFFTLINPKEEKIIYLEIISSNNSQIEIEGIFDIKLIGSIKEVEMDKLSITKLTDNSSQITLKCIEKCKLNYYFNNIDFSGKSNFLNLDDFKFSSNENLNLKIKGEKVDSIEISFLSNSAKICLTNSSIFISFGSKKIEQKIHEDCLILDKIIKLIFSYKKEEIKIEGYVSSLRSTFISI